MHIHIITLFPEFFDGPLNCGLMARAQAAGIIRFSFHNPRDAAVDRHKSVDDRPYGGGPGMVMLPLPVHEQLRALGYTPGGGASPGRLVLLTPGGKPFTQAMAAELAAFSVKSSRQWDFQAQAAGDETGSGVKTGLQPETGGEHLDNGFRQEQNPSDNSSATEPVLTLICGRYEGLDARIEEIYPVESVSVGDFVLNGGETGALCLIEAVARLLPGFMGHDESGEEESFSAGLLEYPQYTRPEVFEGVSVPAALLTGDHGRIARWRRHASLARTLAFRPDLFDLVCLDGDDRAFLKSLRLERPGRNLFCALVHYPVLDKAQNSVAVSLTNLDIHDIARSSCAYGLGGYYVLTPIRDQRNLLESILHHWTQGPGSRSNPDRNAALELVRGLESVEEAIGDITERCGRAPFVLGTTARADTGKLSSLPFPKIAEKLRECPVLLLLGTGHGLSPAVHELCDAFAPPLRWQGSYNHLSVRSALAIMLDRILGDWL